jgi:hypothetical protein
MRDLRLSENVEIFSYHAAAGQIDDRRNKQPACQIACGAKDDESDWRR